MRFHSRSVLQPVAKGYIAATNGTVLLIPSVHLLVEALTPKMAAFGESFRSRELTQMRPSFTNTFLLFFLPVFVV